MDDYAENMVEAVWQKADPTPNPEFRLDSICHALIRRTDYGLLESEFGWVVAPRDADRSEEGSEHLLPLHWANHANREFGRVICAMTANDTMTGNIDVP